MQGVKWIRSLEALKDAGRTHLNLKAVHNADEEFKKANPDVRVMGAKEDWEDRAKACFDALQASGEDVLSANSRFHVLTITSGHMGLYLQNKVGYILKIDCTLLSIRKVHIFFDTRRR